MQAIGIVCEYNPFHTGHQYQIEESRRRLNEKAAVVCAMSGDFVQRGEAAVFSKFARAEAACRAGADLVVELPLPWCLSSAEGFARGAITILTALGCTHLSFGSETGELEKLCALAGFLDRPETLADIRDTMKLDPAVSFARARQLAAEMRFGADAALLSEPNSILAVEYLKALRHADSPVVPMTITRDGDGHDGDGEGVFRSAMQLRKMLAAGEDVSAYVPGEAMAIFQKEQAAGRMKDDRVIDAMLLSRLYQLGPDDFDDLPDAEGGVGRRLYQAIWQGRGLNEAVRLSVSKRCTAARMRRMLLCAALGICADDTKADPPYIRVLACNETGMKLLRSVSGQSPIPILGRAGDVKKLGEHAERVFRLTALAHALYCQQFVTIDDRNPNSDWQSGIVFVKND